MRLKAKYKSSKTAPKWKGSFTHFRLNVDELQYYSTTNCNYVNGFLHQLEVTIVQRCLQKHKSFYACKNCGPPEFHIKYEIKDFT